MPEKLRIQQIGSRDWDHGLLARLVRKLKSRKILVIGDVGVDRYTIGKVERISPEAPVPIVLVVEEKLKLGLAANVADNVQALGGVPFLLGVVGKDRGAQDFRGLLEEAGISARFLVEDPERRTVLKERVVSERQQLLRVDYETLRPVSRAVTGRLQRMIASLVPEVDAVILEDYAKGTFSAELATAIFETAQHAGKLIAVDPNAATPVSFYRGATVLTPNTHEAERLSGIRILDKASLLESGQRILEATEARYVVVTRGREGMAIFSAEDRRVRLIPTFAREVYDVSGAGDTVISVLALALSAGAGVEHACILANIAAGIEVGKRGTATVSPRELESAIGLAGDFPVSRRVRGSSPAAR